VTPGPASAAHSHFVTYWSIDNNGHDVTNIGATPAIVFPDGTSSSLITFAAFDAYDSPVNDAAVAFHTTFGDLTSVTNVGDGTYTAHLTSLDPGDAAITATVGGVPVAGEPATVHFPDDIVTQSTITLGSSSVALGGSTTITVQLKDRTGTDITTSQGPLSVSLAQDPNCLGPFEGGTYHPDKCPNYYALTNVEGDYARGFPATVTAHDNHNGTYSAIFDTNSPYIYTKGVGNFVISASIGGFNLTHGATLTVTASPFSLANSTLTALTNVAPADGTTTTLITLTAKDSAGYPTTVGVTSFNVSTTQGTFGPITDHGDGTYTALLTSPTSSTPVTASITAEINGGGLPASYNYPLTINFLPILDNSTWSVAQADSSVPADGISTYDLTLTVRDSGGGTISDVTAIISTSGYISWNTGNFFPNVGKITYPYDSGTATVQLASTVVGTATISGYINGRGYLPPTTVTFIAPPPPPPSYSGSGVWSNVGTPATSSIASGHGVSLAYDAWVSANINGTAKNFSWRILNAADTVVASGGPLNDTVTDSVSGHDFEIHGSTPITAIANNDTYHLQISLDAPTLWYETPAATLTATPAAVVTPPLAAPASGAMNPGTWGSSGANDWVGSPDLALVNGGTASYSIDVTSGSVSVYLVFQATPFATTPDGTIFTQGFDPYSGMGGGSGSLSATVNTSAYAHAMFAIRCQSAPCTLASGGTWSTTVPAPPAGTIVFPGYSYTVGSTDNALTAPFSVSAGDTVRVTLTAPPSDGGNIGVGCNSISYNDWRNSPSTRDYTFTGFGSNATDCVVYSWNSSSYRSDLTGSGSYAIYSGTVYLGDNSFFTVVNDGWGYGTWGTYATACRLVGNTHVTFTASAPWTMDSYGGTHSAFTVDGTPMGYIDGGGSVAYTNGPFPAGAVDITESDGGSAHSNGGGGTSLCFTQAVVGP
jgi:hypothetical protein